MADKVTAHKVLVLESHEPNGTFISELFKRNGVDCRFISSPTLAISVLGNESFDVVVSGALKWEQCYQLAFAKYGVGRVILYTASPILARGLRMEGMTVYEKSTTDKGYERSFEGLVKEVMKLLDANITPAIFRSQAT
jgi:hypothetical protein